MLVNTLTDRLAEVEVETPGETLNKVKGKALHYTLAEVEAQVMVDRLDHRLAEVKVETLGDTLTYLEDKVLVDKLAERLAVRMVDAPGNTRQSKGRGTGQCTGLHDKSH